MITVVLAINQRLIRHGFRAILQSEADIKIVGEAEVGLEVIHLTKQLKPDVLVMNMSSLGLYGLDVARQLSKSASATRVLMVSADLNEASMLESFANGHNRSIIIDATAEDLVRTIRALKVAQNPIGTDEGRESDIRIVPARSREPDLNLTSRERQVLALVAEGKNVPQIALQLSIGRRTVETHINNVLRKLNLRTRAELIRYALVHKVVVTP